MKVRSNAGLLSVEEHVAQISAGQFIADLHSALGRIEELAQTAEGREALAVEAEQIIEAQRRFQNLAFHISIAMRAA